MPGGGYTQCRWSIRRSVHRGSIRSFTIPSSPCNIPSVAQAHSFNVAVVSHVPLDCLTVWPAGQTLPVVSTLNSVDGRRKSSAAIVAAGQSGAVLQISHLF
ncbi:MAG: hypothetical protein JO307_21160 [Bryobacterales bacterium]|nr:hypothetical protein [Bryobacterales bacterium]